jgi:hypothetical protein
MDTPKGKNYAEFYSQRCGAAMQQHKFEDAVEMAMKGYQVAKDLGDDALRLTFLSVIRLAIEEMIAKAENVSGKNNKTSRQCSFCGQSETAVRLVAGANSVICDICVSKLHEIFSRDKREH